MNDELFSANDEWYAGYAKTQTLKKKSVHKTEKILFLYFFSKIILIFLKENNYFNPSLKGRGN